MSETKKKLNMKQLFAYLTVWDYIAFALCLATIIYYCFVCRMGVAVADEGFYYTITKRMAAGDRLFVDEWHVSQLSAILQYIPYRLFILVTGSTQGIILYMRSLAVIVAQIIYWFVYMKLRKYHLFAVLIAFPYAFWFPGNLLALSYYTLPYFLLMLLYLILFMSEKALSWWKLIALGILYSCVVLVQPIFAVIYVLFSILCMVHGLKPAFLKNYDFILSSKIWKGLTIGCSIAFVLVVGSIVIKSGAANIIKTIPELFTDSEYDLSFGVLLQKVFAKLGKVMRFYGPWLVVCGALCCVLAALYRRFLSEDRRVKTGIFLFAAAVFTAQVVHAVIFIYNYYKSNSFDIIPYYFYFFSVPTGFFGFTCYILCEKKEPRHLMFLLTSFLASLLCGFSSDTHMSVCGPLNQATLLLCLKELWDEVQQEGSAKKSNRKLTAAALKKQKSLRVEKKWTAVVSTVTIATLIFWICANSFSQINLLAETLVNRYPAKEVTQTIERGPLKGIKTTAQIKNSYDNTLADLDDIIADSDGKAFYFATLNPVYYLYGDLPIGTYSTWYVDEDSQSRQLRYWELHPEKRPKYCYIPFYYNYFYNQDVFGSISKENAEKSLHFFKSISDCSVTKGRAGYLVKIVKWK